MTTLTLFKSHSPAIGYVFRSGRTIHFVNGEFATSNKKEIEELTEECENGHPCFYIDATATTIDSETLDPLASLKAKIREEERAKLLAGENRDMGETKFSGKLEGIANSNTIRGLTADSTSTPTSETAGVKVGAVAKKIG